MHRFVRYLFVSLLSPLFAFAAEPPQEIRIGGLYGVSGPVADMGLQFQYGALLAAELHAGSDTVAIVPYLDDHKNDAKTALSAYKKLTTSNSVRIFHVQGSAPALSIKPVAEAENVILFASAAHTDMLKNSRLVLRHANNTNLDSEIMSQAIAAANPGSVGMLSLEQEWAENYSNWFNKNFPRFNKAKLVEEHHLPDETELRTVITRLVSKKPDLVLINSLGTAAGLAAVKLRELGFKGPIYFNNGLSFSTDAQRPLRDHNVQGVFYQDFPDPPAEFSQIFRQRFGSAPTVSALIAFTDYELLAYAVQHAGIEPSGIINFIKGLGQFHGRFHEVSITPEGDMVERTTIKQWPPEPGAGSM